MACFSVFLCLVMVLRGIHCSRLGSVRVCLCRSSSHNLEPQKQTRDRFLFFTLENSEFICRNIYIYIFISFWVSLEFLSYTSTSLRYWLTSFVDSRTALNATRCAQSSRDNILLMFCLLLSSKCCWFSFAVLRFI